MASFMPTSPSSCRKGGRSRRAMPPFDNSPCWERRAVSSRFTPFHLRFRYLLLVLEDSKARGRFRASETGLIDPLGPIQVLSGLFRFGCPHRLSCQRWHCRLLLGNEVHKCKRGFATAEEARAWEEVVRPIGGPSGFGQTEGRAPSDRHRSSSMAYLGQ